METFTIQEAAKATRLSAHTLRYYERIGLIARKENTRRCYSADDIGWIDFLTRLRATDMSIRDMHRYAKLQRQVEERIQELDEHLKLVHYKIEAYGQITEERELEKT